MPCASRRLTWLLVLLLTAAHLGANMAAVRSLCIPTLNRPRLRLALSGALRGLSGALRGPTDPKSPTPNKGGVTVAVPTPREVNPKEPLLPGQCEPMGPQCSPLPPNVPQCPSLPLIAPQCPPIVPTMSHNAPQCPPHCHPLSPNVPQSPSLPPIVPQCPPLSPNIPPLSPNVPQ